jgi:putative tryptophan/tyrosine transport system substrate-binding protein
MRRPIYSTLTLLFIIVAAACTKDSKSGAPTVQTPRKVAVIKFTTHPALDETEAGIKEAFAAAQQIKPEMANVAVEYYNANGNPQLAKQLADNATGQNVALIIAIATPAAQAVARTPSNIPLVYGAVADPEGAGLLTTNRATGIRNVGENIIDRALNFIHTAYPGKKRLGTMFNPAEQNSVYVQSIIKKLAPKYEFELTQVEVRDATQVASSSESLASRVDIIYSANDNTVNAAAASAASVTQATKTPFFLGDLSTLKAGALASIGLEYRAMGRDVGNMAIDLLTGKPLSSLPPRDAPDPQIWVNKRTANILGFNLEGAAANMVNNTIDEGNP